MKRITLRLPDDLHEDLRHLAAEEDRSLNGQILRLLRQSVQEKYHESTVITETAEDSDRRVS